MARSHLYRPFTDEFGNLLHGAVVTVREEDSSTLVAQTLWSSPRDDAVAVPNPSVSSTGYVDIWLNDPQRVSLLLEYTDRAPVSVYLDVLPSASEVVRTSTPLRITNAPALNQMLVAVDGASASWQDPVVVGGAALPHQHAGVGTNSVALGDGAVADSDASTAVGDLALATAAQTSALGWDARATALGSTALGAASRAAGVDSLAVGYGAAASLLGAVAVGYNAVSGGTQSVAIGGTSVASANDAVAVGFASSATGVGAVAIGAHASASGLNSMALGSSAVATHVRSVAIGNSATTTADDQIVLGTASHTVSALGQFAAMGNVSLGGAATTLAFFGGAATTKQAVTGSRGGSAPLAALLTYLAALGLITDSTTA